MKLPENSNVLILSHFYKRAAHGGGPPQQVRDYFSEKVNKIIFIEHPFTYADDTRSSMSIYENGKLVTQLFAPPRQGPEPLFYLADCWINAYFLLRAKTTYTICIALDCFNTVNMIPLRLTGIIKKLIFYTIDYVPQRFPNPILNRLYHLADRLACRFADTIWVLSNKMTKLRRANGVRHIAPSVILPMGANLGIIHLRPLSRIHRHQLVYVGILLEKQGLQIVIQALPGIIKKIKDVRLIIVGKGEYAQTLKKLVRDLNLQKYVKFLGFINNHRDVEKLLCQSAVGLAPYKPSPDNYTYFTDPGKPKLYLGCGLPVVITDVPAIARVITSQGAGVIIDYNVRSVTKGLIKLLSDYTLYKKYRNNALKLSKEYDTNKLISSALEQTN